MILRISTQGLATTLVYGYKFSLAPISQNKIQAERGRTRKLSLQGSINNTHTQHIVHTHTPTYPPSDRSLLLPAAVAEVFFDAALGVLPKSHAWFLTHLAHRCNLPTLVRACLGMLGNACAAPHKCVCECVGPGGVCVLAVWTKTDTEEEDIPDSWEACLGIGSVGRRTR